MAVNRLIEPQLEIGDIQGDILVGLQKDFEWFVFFEIAKVPEFKKFMTALLPLITTTTIALEREDAITALKATGSTDRLHLLGINIGFSMPGLTKLGLPNVNTITDPSFKAGLAARSASLNDPTTGPNSPPNWKVGGPANTPDGVLLITGPTQSAVDTLLGEVKAIAGTSWTIIHPEMLGKTRAADRGHEHFGFLDGVSQPGVRGRIDHAFSGKMFLQDSQNPNDPDQGLPGADLLWPGEFVFGYAGQDATDADTPSAPVSGGPNWMKNGAFMVFRRLNQFVPEFNHFVETTAAGFGTTADIIGARMVGRWKSGAPAIVSPLQDDPLLGNDELHNNDFDFDGDPEGRKCPFAAHIRKAYPRNDVTPAGLGKPTDFDRREASEADTETHRIMRRGIPFGDEVTDNEQRNETTANERGLMFVCYQTSIVEQFEFLTHNWVNNPAFAPAGSNPGFDPLLGQDPAHAPRPVKGLDVIYPKGPLGGTTTLPIDFIRPTGGGYFFVPSISTIKNHIAA